MLVLSFMKYGIIFHGGAGPADKNRKDYQEQRQIMKELATSSKNLLDSGDDATTVIEGAICRMEDSGLFNAGRGSCLTINQTIEMDAGMMCGKDLSCGAVAVVKNFANPIKIARRVMEDSKHSLIAGKGVDSFAFDHGIQHHEMSPTAANLEKFDKMIKGGQTDIGHDTVGGIAIDKEGNIAAGVSTGGVWLKKEGRVGDSAIVGSGFYADNMCGAAVATGNGDVIMKSCLSKNVCDLLSSGVTVQHACKKGIENLSKLQGFGGVISVDKRGNFSFYFNSQIMPCSWFFSGMGEPSVS